MAIGGRGFGWGRSMHGMGMPNYGGSELSSYSSWSALSRGMTNFGNLGQKLWTTGSQMKGIYKTGEEDRQRREQAKAKANAEFVAKNERAVGIAAAELVKGLKKVAAATSDINYKRAVEKVTQQFLDASRAATTVSQKLEALGKTSNKINQLASSARGTDRKLMVDFSNATIMRQEKVRQQIRQNQSHRVASLTKDSFIRFSHTVGRMFGYAAQLKHAIDASNLVFQAVNSKVNQFARMQMAVTSERGGYGRQIRGAGINFGGMMAAIAAGRSAGMDDRQVIGQMVSLQTRLAQARWGEGDLIDKAGRWGISTYNRNGSVKSNDEMMVEFSRKLRSLGSAMEKLQFLSHLGFQPEQMEYVANFEREQKRMQFLKQNPHLQGVLDRANILDESGFSAKADAATKLELKRRQILNQNAVEEGLIPAITRSLHPENWFFSDWTAREKGVKQAKGEMAMERLTQAINDEIKEKGKSSNVVDNVVAKLSPEDVASLAAVMQKDIDNKGDKSIYSAVLKNFENEFGMVFDTRSPIEKLQAALVPVTNQIAKWVEDIVNFLTKSETSKFVANNPKTTLGIVGGTAVAGLGLLAAIRHPIKSAQAIKGIWGWAKGAFGKGAVGAAESAGAKAAAGSKSPIKDVVRRLPSTVAGSRPDATGRYPLDATVAESKALAAKGKLVGEIPTTTHTASLSGAKAAKGTGFLGNVGKSLKGGFSKGSIITTAIFAIPDAISTYKSYSEGNTKTGNRKAGELVGGIGGSLAGAKVGAALGAFGGPVGIAIGGILGAIGGGLLGDKLGGGIGDWVSDKTGAKDTPLTKEEEHESAIEGGDKFIKEIQELCQTTEGLKKAQEKLLEKGIRINEGILKSKKFQTDAQYAKETANASFLMEMLGAYASRTGSSISESDFNMKAQSNPYIAAALENGMEISQADMVTGASGKGSFSLGIIENYLKNGGLDQKTLGGYRDAIRKEHPEWSQSKIDEAAENRAREEFNKGLSQSDYENAKSSLVEQARTNRADRAYLESAKEKGVDESGKIWKRYGNEMVQVNEKGNWIGDEGSELAGDDGKPIHVADITEDELEAVKRVKEIKHKNPNLNRKPSSKELEFEDKMLNGSSREQNSAVLQYMKEKGLGDVEHRTEGQKFEEEQIDDFEKFMQEHKEMSGAQAISEYAIAKGLSKNQVRDIAYAGLSSSATFGMNAAKGLSEEARKGVKGKAAASEEARAKRKARQERDYEAAAKGASDEEISAALEDEGDVATYKRLAAKKAAGGGLTDNEKEAFKNFTTKIGRKVTYRKSSSSGGRKDYEPTDEEKAAMKNLAKANAGPATGDTDQEGYKGMGDTSGVGERNRISRAAYRPHRRQHIAALRRGAASGLEGGRRIGLGGARFTGKHAGVGARFTGKEAGIGARFTGKEAGIGANFTVGKIASAEQAVSAMASAGAQAESAAASAKNLGGGGGNKQTVTVTIAGTTVNQTFNNADATEPRELKDTMANVGSTIGDKYASALVMQAKDLGVPV